MSDFEFSFLTGDVDDACLMIDQANAIAPAAVDDALTRDDYLMHLAEAVADVQDLIRKARELEGYLTHRLGQVVRSGEREGYLPDGRMFRLHKTADRKAWRHDEWKRDARAIALKAQGVEPDTTVEVVDTWTGETHTERLGAVVMAAMIALQEFHGAGAPRTGTLKANGLDPADYCEQVPGSWKLDAIAPSENHDQED